MNSPSETSAKLPMILDSMIRKAWPGLTTKAWPAETETASPTGYGAGISIAAQKKFDKVQLPTIECVTGLRSCMIFSYKIRRLSDSDSDRLRCLENGCPGVWWRHEMGAHFS